MSAAQPLTRTQTQSSVIAGAVAHTLFQVGWFAFGMSLAALVATALFGNIVAALTRSLGGEDAEGVMQTVEGGSELLFWVVVSFLVGSVILIGLAVLVSGWMLSAAGVRTPWKFTMTAIGVAALVDIALFWVYVGLANLLTESRVAGPVLLTPVVALIGGIVVGSVIWWLVTRTRRVRPGATPQLHSGAPTKGSASSASSGSSTSSASASPASSAEKAAE